MWKSWGNLSPDAVCRKYRLWGPLRHYQSSGFIWAVVTRPDNNRTPGILWIRLLIGDHPSSPLLVCTAITNNLALLADNALSFPYRLSTYCLRTDM